VRTQRSASARSSSAPHLDDRGLLLQQLEHAAALVDAVATRTSVVCAFGTLESAPRACSSARRGGVALALGRQQHLRLETVTTRRGTIIGSVRAAGDDPRDASAEPVARSSCSPA
jgi:hypothetical protein